MISRGDGAEGGALVGLGFGFVRLGRVGSYGSLTWRVMVRYITRQIMTSQDRRLMLQLPCRAGQQHTCALPRRNQAETGDNSLHQSNQGCIKRLVFLAQLKTTQSSLITPKPAIMPVPISPNTSIPHPVPVPVLKSKPRPRNLQNPPRGNPKVSSHPAYVPRSARASSAPPPWPSPPSRPSASRPHGASVPARQTQVASPLHSPFLDPHPT